MPSFGEIDERSVELAAADRRWPRSTWQIAQGSAAGEVILKRMPDVRGPVGPIAETGGTSRHGCRRCSPLCSGADRLSRRAATKVERSCRLKTIAFDALLDSARGRAKRRTRSLPRWPGQGERSNSRPLCCYRPSRGARINGGGSKAHSSRNAGSLGGGRSPGKELRAALRWVARR